jgi:hypothetical protein
MKLTAGIGLLMLSLGAAAGSYVATMAIGGNQPAATAPTTAPAPQDALVGWLALSSNQTQVIKQADPQFPVDSEKLSTDLQAERLKLAALLDEPQTPNQAILSQVERVIATHDALERRVAGYVLAIRPHLTADQQKRLLGLCAEGVRQAHGWRGGRGTGAAGQGRGPWWRNNTNNNPIPETGPAPPGPDPGQQRGARHRGGSS